MIYENGFENEDRIQDKYKSNLKINKKRRSIDVDIHNFKVFSSET